LKTIAAFALILASTGFSAGISITESSTDGMSLTLISGMPVFGTTVMRGAEYATVSIPGAENLAEAGFPRLPVYRAWIQIPIGATVDVSVTELRVETPVGPALPVEPAVISAEKSRSRDSFTVVHDPGVYSQGTPYPSDWVNVVYAGEMRGHNLALVEITPLRWNPAAGYTLLAGAEIRLDFSGGDLARSYDRARRFACDDFGRVLETLTVNHGIFEHGTDTPPAPYLIIGHSDFVTTGMDAFVSHKQARGFEVTMVDLSVTGSTHGEIQSYIHNALENWPNPPSYVLLVGDIEYMPGFPATTYGGSTDLYYVALDDGGYLPDAFIGRFSVQSTGQAILMAQRVIDYENSVGIQGWVQNLLWIASTDNYQISEGTHNYCITNYCDPRGYSSIKVYPVSTGGNAAQAVAAINNGLSMVTFSGHGSSTSWGDMSFQSSHFNQLTNDGMFPGVLSHACDTGNYSVSTCWAETWTRTPERGGLYFWGSWPSSYWTEDDIQEKAEYEWFLQDDIHWPMGYMNGGLLAVFTYFSGGGRSRYYHEAYHLFGDPSVITKTWPMVGIEDETIESGLSLVTISVANPVTGAVPVFLSGAGGHASLEVYDIAGRLVDRPFSGTLAGQATVTWQNQNLGAGVYFLRLSQGDNIATSKVTLIR